MIRLKRLYAHDFKQLRQIELDFPEAGRILVQGKNEAGKSTLFEAIFFALFAQALTTEGGAKNLDDLIGYDKEKARVELDLAVRDRLFKITRTLIRDKSNKWELEIVRPDGAREEVRGNKAVNDRLVAELGFDAEALLNTCFVEQKKLEKLEGMGKAKREESLAKLLNLERLLDLEEELKLRGEDEKLLIRLQHRVELGRAQTELPGVAEELRRAQTNLKMLDLRAQVERAIQETEASQAFEKELKELSEQRERLTTSVARVDALDRARQVMGAALIRCDALAQDGEQLANLRREREEIQHAVDEHLPALERRQRDIRRLGQQAGRLTRVEAARGEALSELQRAQSLHQELDGNLERGKTLNASIAQHEKRIAELDEKLRVYDVGDALGEWALATQETWTGDDLSEDSITKRQEREALNRAQRQNLFILGGMVLAIILLSALVLPTLAISTSSFFLTVIVALLLAALATLAILYLAGRLMQTNRELARVTEELGSMEGETKARRALAGPAQARVTVAVEKLTALNIAIPDSAATAQARRVELAATLENKTRVELAAERDDERERLNYARAQRDEVVKRIDELSPATDGVNMAQLERTCEKAEHILNQWRPRLARRAAQFDLPPETEALRDAYRAGQSDIKIWQQRVEQGDKVAKDAAVIQARMTKTQDELQEHYARATTLLNGNAPGWSPSLERAAYVMLELQLNEAFQAAGGNDVRAALAQMEKQLGALEREHTIRTRNARESIAAARALEGELGIEDGLGEEPTLDELQEMVTHLSQVNPEERSTLEAQVGSLYQRVGALRGIRERFERELGLVGETVNLEQAEEDLASERQAQAQRKYGAEIVTRARRRIVQKILPATMEYMRRILPQLTRDRYHDAELDPESYKIKVWDERAGQSGAWKEKNIFSGGTKDQFSLALRLAFALATLPQERGTSPGFIFLDEPLGSFDEERANALLYLLTEGEIGRAFDQIFLISHVPVQESKFTHRIRLENGAVVDSNLEK